MLLTLRGFVCVYVCMCVSLCPRGLLPSVSEEYLSFLQRTAVYIHPDCLAICEAKGKFNFSCMMCVMGLDLGGQMCGAKKLGKLIQQDLLLSINHFFPYTLYLSPSTHKSVNTNEFSCLLYFAAQIQSPSI